MWTEVHAMLSSLSVDLQPQKVGRKDIENPKKPFSHLKLQFPKANSFFGFQTSKLLDNLNFYSVNRN